MTSKQKTKYGYWSDEQAKHKGHSIYDSAQGPVKVSMISDDPPEIFLKKWATTWNDLKYVDQVSEWLSSRPHSPPNAGFVGGISRGLGSDIDKWQQLESDADPRLVALNEKLGERTTGRKMEEEV